MNISPLPAQLKIWPGQYFNQMFCPLNLAGMCMCLCIHIQIYRSMAVLRDFTTTGTYLELLSGGGLAISIADLHIIGRFWGRRITKLLPQQVDVGLDEQVALAAACRVSVQLDARRIHLRPSTC